MKKLISFLLCFVLAFGCCAANLTGVIASQTTVDTSTVYATKSLSVPNLEQVDETWGEKAIHVDKNMDSAFLHPYEAGRTPEDSAFDLYLNWDANNLYLGLVSEDNDVAGNNNSWEGDGIQFKIQAGDNITGDAKNIYFTFNADGATFAYGNNGDTTVCTQYNLTMVGNKMHAVVAVPFAQLGLVASDIKAGAKLAIQLIRITATTATNGNYAGWLTWGEFFPNNEVEKDVNTIILSDELTDSPMVVKAQKNLNAPNMEQVDASWGEVFIHVDKDSYNAHLHAYEAGRTPEASAFDLYLNWDETNLYLGLVSEDNDVTGQNSTPWEGDGIQFKIQAGTSITGDAKNIYFTFDQNGAAWGYGDNGDPAVCTNYNLKMVGNKMHAVVAVPFAELGMTASDIKANATLAIQLIRITATTATNGNYAGWLTWGEFFPANDEVPYDNNIIVLDSTLASNPTVVTAKKTDVAPNMTKVDPSWGYPVISVTPTSYNADLHPYENGRVPEDSSFDLYLVWDNTNLYLGLVSEDNDVTGQNSTPWEGDGIQFKIQAGNAVTGDAANIYFTFDQNGAAWGYGDNGDPAVCTDYNLSMVGNKMHAVVAIPFEKLGMTASDIKESATLAIQLIRITATTATNGNYAGWLTWGEFFSNNNVPVHNNIITLSNDKVEDPTVVYAQKNNNKPNLTQVDETWGEPAISVDKNSFNADLHPYENGRVPEDSAFDLYLNWDETNLYLGLVSEDNDVTGQNSTPWEGDGIQFQIQAGNTITGDAKNIYFTFDQNGAAWGYGDNGNDSICSEYNLKMVGNEMHAVVAIPFAQLGMTASDIKVGANVAIKLIRITATTATNGNYAGWLTWGDFFGHGNVPYENNNIVLSSQEVDNVTVVEAKRNYNAPNMAEIDETWGEPAIHVDKNSFNADLHPYESGRVPEDSAFDLYLNWDETNLYLGLISEDNDVTGQNSTPWEGDGIQFQIQAGKTLTGDAKNIYFTFDQNGVNWGYGDNGNDSICTAYNLKMVGNKMHAMVAVPFAELGMTSSDIKANAALAIKLIRITATTATNGNYAGWLTWGDFFGHGNVPIQSNVILLSNEEVENVTVVEAKLNVSAPNMEQVDASWGEAVIHVDKDSYNAFLHAYEAGRTPEDSAFDLYLNWDETNLYLGLVSEDNNVTGQNSTPWEGDGIQFKIQAGTSITGDAANIYFTFDQNGAAWGYGDNGDPAVCTDYNLKMVGNKMHAVVAVPFAQLGMTASDIKANATLAIQLIRITATTATNGNYAGWLTWGDFFGSGEVPVSKNIIKLSSKLAENPCIVTADSIEAAPNMQKVDSTWGEAVLHVDKDTYNADLHAYEAGRVPEDSAFDLYLRWDATNLYLGLVSEDNDVTGQNSTPWEGDGIQFKIQAGTAITGDAANIYFTFDQNGTAWGYGDNGDPAVCTTYNLSMVGNKMHAVVAIPFEKLGLTASDIKAGANLAIQLIRITATTATNGNYAGWLTWGDFFGSGNTEAKLNVIVLADKQAQEGAEEGGDTFVSKLTNVNKTALGVVDVAGMGGGHKLVSTSDGSLYIVYVDRSNVTGYGYMNEFTLIKVSGSTYTEVAFGYVESGDVDVFVDSFDNIYILGGGSTWDIEANSRKYDYTKKAEQASLHFYCYSPKLGFMQDYTADIPFAVATAKHEYIASTVVDGEKVTVAYVGATATKQVVEFFSFDFSNLKWTRESKKLELSTQELGMMELYYANDELQAVYQLGDKICITEKNTQITGTLLNAKYMLGNLYIQTDTQAICYSSTTQKALDLDANNAVIVDSLSRIVIDKDAPATAVVYDCSGDSATVVATIKLDEDVKAVYPIMSYVNTQNGQLHILFAGQRGTQYNWYLAKITLE